MNRQRYIDRDLENEGTQRGQQLALALAQTCDEEFLETMLHHKAALDEFGGQLYIAAGPRVKLNREGEAVEASEPGSYETLGYIFHYGSRATLKRVATEEEVSEREAPAETDSEASTADEPELEPVEA